VLGWTTFTHEGSTNGAEQRCRGRELVVTDRWWRIDELNTEVPDERDSARRWTTLRVVPGGRVAPVLPPEAVAFAEID